MVIHIECHLRRLRQMHREKCTDSLEWLKTEGYTAKKLTIKNDQTGDSETIKLTTELLQEEEVPEEELDRLDMVVHVKDRCHISGNAYGISGNAHHEMAQLFKEIPHTTNLRIE